MFRPVLKSRSPTFEQLRKVMFPESRASSAIDSAFASTLAAKLNVCNENVAQVTRFLSSVANRGLKMKDHMKRILRGGEYHFTVTDTVCSLQLSCRDTGIRYAPSVFEVVSREETSIYNLADLQDLRSRARLVLSTHKAQAKRFGTGLAGIKQPVFVTFYVSTHFITSVGDDLDLFSHAAQICSNYEVTYSNSDGCSQIFMQSLL